MKSLLKKIITDTNPLLLTYHRSKALIAAAMYGFPARKLTVIGITGTDGKTTTVGMLAHILNENTIKAGALSTAFFQVGNAVEWNATQKTSPSPFIIQKFLKRLRNEGCTHAVLEYSSHGLLQGRNWFTWPAVAAITNLSEEHLDYHGTMENYMKAKSILFRMMRKNGTKVLNADDRTYLAYRNIRSAKTIAYSVQKKEADLFATNVVSTVSGTNAIIQGNTLTMPIPGSFNVQNALCAIGCAESIGVARKDAISSLSNFKGIPGRMELIDEGQPFNVIVEFPGHPQDYEKTASEEQTGE